MWFLAFGSRISKFMTITAQWRRGHLIPTFCKIQSAHQVSPKWLMLSEKGAIPKYLGTVDNFRKISLLIWAANPCETLTIESTAWTVPTAAPPLVPKIVFLKCARNRDKQKTRAGIGWKDKELITEYLDPWFGYICQGLITTLYTDTADQVIINHTTGM